MAIRLEIRSSKHMNGEMPWERVFDQRDVTIGRAASNDVALQDPQRVVSSRHAEIRWKGGACVLVDVGSTNGTSMNERQLVPQREYPLHEGDRIAIGDFTIVFFMQTPPTNGMAHRVVEEPLTALQSGDADALVYELCRRYAELSGATATERKKDLSQMVQQALRRQNTTRESLIGRVRTGLHLRLGRPATAPAGDAAVAPPAHTPCSAADAAYEALLALARKYCTRQDTPMTAEFITQFARRIDRVLQITFANLVEALRGRRQFARELEVEATRILNWAPNQIKQAENEQQVGAYLLDPSNSRGTEAVMADLERVFHDLALHQIGMIKGFQESLRAVLREFDPDAIEAGITRPMRIGPFRLPAFFRVLKNKAVWTHFKSKHQRFTEDEVRIFEQILAPHFAKGYMDVQKTQRGH